MCFLCFFIGIEIFKKKHFEIFQMKYFRLTSLNIGYRLVADGLLPLVEKQF